MTRPSLRRTPMMERLETRQVLSGFGGMTDDKQYALELINRARTNPREAAERFTSNLSPDVEATLEHFQLDLGSLKHKIASTAAKPPLAYSDALDAAAQGQSQAQADMGQQTHLDKSGKTLDQRLDEIGYKNRSSSGENTYAYAESNDHAIEAFSFDWGNRDQWHYRTLFDSDKSAEDSFNEVGIGIVKTSGKGLGPMVITQDFVSREGAKPRILGVVYDDRDRDNFYTPGEGKGGVTIEATNLDNGRKTRGQTWKSGGYQLDVEPNANYRVTELIDGVEVKAQDVYVAGLNEKVDFVRDGSKAVSSTDAPAQEMRVATTPSSPPARVEPEATQATDAPESSTPAKDADHPSWLGKWSQWRNL